MAAIPVQRAGGTGADEAPAPFGTRPLAEGGAILPGSPAAPGSARTLVRAAFTDWAALGLTGPDGADRLREDATAVVSELVTNAVVHAGTEVEVDWRLEESGAFTVEVHDQHPARAPRDPADDTPYETSEHGRGLRLVATLAESWGVTYRTGRKTVWARLPPGGTEEPAGPAPAPALV
ncbi:protein phosphatase, partial [Streptomyces bauhiniae]